MNFKQHKTMWFIFGTCFFVAQTSASYSKNITKFLDRYIPVLASQPLYNDMWTLSFMHHRQHTNRPPYSSHTVQPLSEEAYNRFSHCNSSAPLSFQYHNKRFSPALWKRSQTVDSIAKRHKTLSALIHYHYKFYYPGTQFSVQKSPYCFPIIEQLMHRKKPTAHQIEQALALENPAQYASFFIDQKIADDLLKFFSHYPWLNPKSIVRVGRICVMGDHTKR